jgi:predicted amidohydrolase
MKVTVCELSDQEGSLIADWEGLKSHIREAEPDLVVLPEMPFCEWFAGSATVSAATKLLSVAKHDKWMSEVERLDVQQVIYSRPVLDGGKFLNTAFIFERGIGHQKIHSKSRFPEEADFWEETWFDHEAVESFKLIESKGIKIGVLLCTEMWFMEVAREYGKRGMDLLLCPRATGRASADKWMRCGQTLAVISGAFCLSSNRSGMGVTGVEWGGMGWITEPVSGNLLAVTDATKKFVTWEIDIGKSKLAKELYPQNVR